jgi:hypothetical protein
VVSITDSVDVVAQYVIDKLKANATVLKSSTNIVVDPQDIYYGDQEKFPRSPSICVDPGNRARQLQGVSYRTDNNFTIYILVYHAKLQDNELTRKESQQISEAIETLLHSDPQLGGNVIHGFCSLNESGYVYRQNTMYRTNRITFEPYSKTRLR